MVRQYMTSQNSSQVTEIYLGVQGVVGAIAALVLTLIFPLNGWYGLFAAAMAVLGSVVYGSESRHQSGAQRHVFKAAAIAFTVLAIVWIIEWLLWLVQ